MLIARVDQAHVRDALLLRPGAPLDAQTGLVARDAQTLRDQAIGVQGQDLMLGIRPRNAREQPASGRDLSELLATRLGHRIEIDQSFLERVRTLVGPM